MQRYDDLLKGISGVYDDSRLVKPGGLFVAIKGITVDSHHFIEDVIAKGAKVIVGETKPEKAWLEKVNYVRVKNSRKALGEIASAWYGYPFKKLKVIGVTGTDGKTTTANIIWWILSKSGVKTGLVSTIGAKIGSKHLDTGLHVSNPEPLELQELLSKMVAAKCEYVVLEVTSHGIDQHRIAGIKFDIAVLTNITGDHIDYHGSFVKYRNTKIKLFQKSKFAVLNKKDPSTKIIIKKTEAKITLYNEKSLKGELKKTIKKKFPEDFNTMNSIAATLVAKKIGISNNKIINAIKTFPGVEGRMQKVKNDKGIRIIIDFAHTPNGLKEVLKSLKSDKGQLISIISCEGERDRKKREEMPEISTRIADLTILNPIDTRSENPHNILNEMKNGAKKGGGKFKAIVDRGDAVLFAIKAAKPGDTVAILGKGHEKSMNLYEIEYPWSDLKAVNYALKNKSLHII